MNSYDVALWRWWPSPMPDVVEVVQAFSPRSAVYDLMERSRLRVVARVAVREVVPLVCPGSDEVRGWRGVGLTLRWYDVVCPLREEVTRDD
jgi:hypothetical protein